MAHTYDMDGSMSKSISERQEKKKKKPYNPYGKGSIIEGNINKFACKQKSYWRTD